MELSAKDGDIEIKVKGEEATILVSKRPVTILGVTGMIQLSKVLKKLNEKIADKLHIKKKKNVKTKRR